MGTFVALFKGSFNSLPIRKRHSISRIHPKKQSSKRVLADLRSGCFLPLPSLQAWLGKQRRLLRGDACMYKRRRDTCGSRGAAAPGLQEPFHFASSSVVGHCDQLGSRLSVLINIQVGTKRCNTGNMAIYDTIITGNQGKAPEDHFNTKVELFLMALLCRTIAHPISSSPSQPASSAQYCLNGL